jgi:uridine kinase
LDEKKYLYVATIIIAEVIMALHDPTLRELYDLKVFVQCDSDIMLARRIQRDVRERGRTVDGILEQYLRYVKPSYDHFVSPSSKFADIIVPGSDNSVAIELISTHIRRKLEERSNRFRHKMAIPHLKLHPEEYELQDLDLTVLNQTPQLKGIFTILRDRTTTRQDFIFFMDRLATLLAEKAQEHLPYIPKTVVTPVGVETHGKQLDASYICGVSILRTGGALERGFKRVFNSVPVGSLLVQSDNQTGEPTLLHVKLPVCVRERHKAVDTWVFILDAQIGTGAAAFMSVRVLLDHGIRQDRIVFVTYLVARRGGVAVLRRAFPKIKIVCGAVDETMKEAWLEGFKAEGNPEGKGRKVWVMQPGMGQIGDRYYL